MRDEYWRHVERRERLRHSFEEAAWFFPEPVALPDDWRWDDFINLRLFALVDVPLRELPRGFFDRQSSFGCRQHYQGFGVDDCGLVVLLSGNRLGLEVSHLLESYEDSWAAGAAQPAWLPPQDIVIQDNLHGRLPPTPPHLPRALFLDLSRNDIAGRVGIGWAKLCWDYYRLRLVANPRLQGFTKINRYRLGMHYF